MVLAEKSGFVFQSTVFIPHSTEMSGADPHFQCLESDFVDIRAFRVHPVSSEWFPMGQV